MALVVEDGTGVVGADSFVSLAAADAHHSSRGNTAWAAALGASRESALRRVYDYLYVWYYSGWPYADLTAEEIALDLSALQQGSILLAPIALSSELMAATPESPQLLSSTKSVGPLTKSETYVDRSDSAIMLGGRDVSFLTRLLSRLSSTGGLVLGSRYRG